MKLVQLGWWASCPVSWIGYKNRWAVLSLWLQLLLLSPPGKLVCRTNMTAVDASHLDILQSGILEDFTNITTLKALMTSLMLFMVCLEKQMLARPYIMTSVYWCLDVRYFLSEIFQYNVIIFWQIEGLILKNAEFLQFLKFNFSQVQKIQDFSGIAGFNHTQQFAVHNNKHWQTLLIWLEDSHLTALFSRHADYVKKVFQYVFSIEDPVKTKQTVQPYSSWCKRHK